MSRDTPSALRFAALSRRVLLIGMSVVCALACGSVARAQPRPSGKMVLEVEGDPTGCLVESDLRRRVHRWLARHAVDPAVTLSVRTRPHSPSFTVRRAGRLIAVRRFEFPRASCGDRREALALAIALALEAERHPSAARTVVKREAMPPRRVQRAVARSAVHHRRRGRALPPSVELAPEAPIAEAEAMPPLSEPSVRLGAFAGGVFVAAALPDAMSGMAAGLELHFGESATLMIGGLATPEHELTLGLGKLRLSLVAGRMLGCANWMLSGLRVAGCVGGVAGMVFAEGSGFAAENRHASAAWVAGLFGVSADFPARGTVALRGSLGGMINARRPVLWVKSGNDTVADRSGLLGLEASLALVVLLS